MKDASAVATNTTGPARSLAGIGASMILVGLLCGLTIGAAPYPRLMLTAHIQFLVNGMVALLAAGLLKSSLSVVEGRGATIVVWGHAAAWAVPLSEVLMAITGAKRALPIAAAQAGAPGAASGIEVLVLACHLVPAVLLIFAWVALVAGIRGGRSRGAAMVT